VLEKHINGETEPENAEKKEITQGKATHQNGRFGLVRNIAGSAPNAAAYWPTRKAVLFARTAAIRNAEIKEPLMSINGVSCN